MQLGAVSNRLCVRVAPAWLRYVVTWLSVLRVQQVQVLAPLSVQCLGSGILPGTASKQWGIPLPLPFQNIEQPKLGRQGCCLASYWAWQSPPPTPPIPHFSHSVI